MQTIPLNLIATRLRPALPGFLLAVLTLLYGFGLGIVFGAGEEAVVDHLKSKAEAVRDAVYKGNDAAMAKVLDKSWNYFLRAHLHAGGLGASSVGMICILVLLGRGAAVTRWVSLALGAGSLGYALYWMLAGLRAPSLGSTGAAKESLKWLAMPTSGAVVIATLAVAVLIAVSIFQRNRDIERV